MKKDVAKKWVKALKNGKYKQGQGYLKQYTNRGEPRHCCLGVLCELYNNTMKKNHKKTLWVKDCEHYDLNITKFDAYDGLLPIQVRKWAGMLDSLGTFTTTEKDGTLVDQCLADLNDSGKKFSTIADIIENNVENL